MKVGLGAAGAVGAVGLGLGLEHWKNRGSSIYSKVKDRFSSGDAEIEEPGPVEEGDNTEKINEAIQALIEEGYDDTAPAGEEFGPVTNAVKDNNGNIEDARAVLDLHQIP